MAMLRCCGGKSLARVPPIIRSPEVIVFQAGQHAQQGRLAAAGRADQHDEFTGLDVEVDVFEDLMLAEGFRQVAKQDVGHGHAPNMSSMNGRQPAVSPASTGITTPVTPEARSEARKATASATSEALTMRPSG